ncbi:MAG: hypothetical protein LAP87_14890 [Acidobacteriia bacterium]|nr:hypothetical protein [Terriglobia bacterium]
MHGVIPAGGLSPDHARWERNRHDVSENRVAIYAVRQTGVGAKGGHPSARELGETGEKREAKSGVGAEDGAAERQG